MGNKLHLNDDCTTAIFQCPACGNCHQFHIAPAKNPLTGASWTFNGDVKKPTFSPSVLIRAHHSSTVARPPWNSVGWQGSAMNWTYICHSHVADGKITFCADSTHPLAGKTVELPDWAS